MNEVEKAKKILGVGFLGSISVAVESLKNALDTIKSALGLPQDAKPVEVQEKISGLITEKESLREDVTKSKAIATEGGKAMGESTEEQWYKKGTVIIGAITFIAIIILGTFWIILYALQADGFAKRASIFGVAALMGGGFFSFGIFLGFLFGIPRTRTAVKTPEAGTPQAGTPQAGAPQAGAPQAGTPQTGAPQTGVPQAGPPQTGPPQTGTPQTGAATTSLFGVNTNLEQVSDWLTKIVVGVTLTQLNTIPDRLKGYAKSFASNLGGFPNAEAFAVGLLIYYLTVGFMGGYLLTRLYLKKEFEKAEKPESLT